MSKLFKPRSLPGPAHLGVAVLRVLAGVALVLHSMSKIDNPTGWLPGDAFPAWALAFAAYGELIGGALLALGLLTPLAALVVLGVMAGAVKFHLDSGDPFVAAGERSWELAAMHAATALLVLTTGPGAISLDNLLFNKKSGKG